MTSTTDTKTGAEGVDLSYNTEKYSFTSNEDVKESIKDKFAKELGIDKKGTIGATLDKFSEDTGIHIPNEKNNIWRQYIRGRRFALPGVFLLAQFAKKPLTYFLGNSLFAYEKQAIFKHLGFHAIGTLRNGNIGCALPFSQVSNADIIKQWTLPNDVEQYKEGELCLIDVSIKKADVPGIYLIRDQSRVDSTLAVVHLDGSGQPVAGKVTNILTRV
ncbi:hypothetical protein [Pseudoalteromonas rubra]|uniref:hypothetical protein n=1 Tax=Pseudoalteromonas rubra TaxID=43658 RepID=UPI002DB563C1|nr:hypothetical protein [Pseudoalteromonas rubra]MEC4091597.1 hypothetical protein [Pseudoalteromonas rubra]